MKAVLTSNLVSSETKKTTTACNFQTMGMNFLAMPRELLRGQIGSYAYCQCEASRSFMMEELRKSALRNTYTIQQNQN